MFRSAADTPAQPRVSDRAAARAVAAEPSMRRSDAGPGLWEVVFLWALCGALALALFVTYLRVPSADLYRMADGGPAGAVTRTVIALNFPISVVAIPLVAVVIARLLAHPWAASPIRRRVASAVAVLAVALCLVTAWPGAIEDNPYTAQPINALPILGVALALGLTVFTARVCGLGTLTRAGRWDIARLALAAGLTAISLPWLLADLGVYIGDVPLLGAVFISKEVPPGETLPAVHLGHHHGVDGLLYVVTALALTRPLARIAGTRLRAALSFVLAFLFVYGVAILANDAWGEQLVKRGWTSVHIPSVLWPAVTPAWGVVLVTIVVVHLVLMWALRRQAATPAR